MRHRSDGPVKTGSLRQDLPERPLAEELVDILEERPGMRIERIVSTGHATADGEWYDQDSDEFVLLVEGVATLRIEGEPEDRTLQQGDWLLFPAHCRHRVTSTRADPPTVWLAVHFGQQDNEAPEAKDRPGS